jgi:hypothetical protein
MVIGEKEALRLAIRTGDEFDEVDSCVVLGVGEVLEALWGAEGDGLEKVYEVIKEGGGCFGIDGQGDGTAVETEEEGDQPISTVWQGQDDDFSGPGRGGGEGLIELDDSLLERVSGPGLAGFRRRDEDLLWVLSDGF